MDHFIDTVVATADATGARLRSSKKIDISFDEWNVWYQRRYSDEGNPPEWRHAPRLIEDQYDVADAVVVGGLLISLLRHSDRVAAACLAQLVNVIAPIRSEPGGPAWRQTTFYPFAQASRLANGTVLRTHVSAPTIETRRFGDVPAVDAVVTYDDESGDVVVLATNRHQVEDIELSIELGGFAGLRVAEATALYDVDNTASNTEQEPTRVVPRTHENVTVDGGRLTAVLKPVSWNAIRLSPG
jgi:alpha-N-arabinofuranosidase